MGIQQGLGCPNPQPAPSSTNTTTTINNTAVSDRQWLILLTLINGAMLLVMLGKGK